jgi:hypothetical protein
MTWLQSARSRYVTVGLASALVGFLLAWPLLGSAQDKPPAKDQAGHPAPADPAKDVADQLRMLTAKVARLEAAVAKIAPPPAGTPGMAGGGMAGGGTSGGMGMDGMMSMMMGGQKGGMTGMAAAPGGGMSMTDDMDMMGMGGMGGQKGMKMRMAAALPGFPGASHLYHIGATDFFLDHPEHVALSTDQQVRLNGVKQKAVADKANGQRRVEEAEQQMWELTASDQPDAAKIEAKVREIEKLRGDQRMSFIRSVGEAAQALTDDQRKSLLGLAPAAPGTHVHPKTP